MQFFISPVNSTELHCWEYWSFSLGLFELLNLPVILHQLQQQPSLTTTKTKGWFSPDDVQDWAWTLRRKNPKQADYHQPLYKNLSPEGAHKKQLHNLNIPFGIYRRNSHISPVLSP